jgi:hypothetical protein
MTHIGILLMLYAVYRLLTEKPVKAKINKARIMNEDYQRRLDESNRKEFEAYQARVIKWLILECIGMFLLIIS